MFPCFQILLSELGFYSSEHGIGKNKMRDTEYRGAPADRSIVPVYYACVSYDIDIVSSSTPIDRGDNDDARPQCRLSRTPQ